MGFFSDLVNGKEKTINTDPLARDINKAGKSGIGYLTAGADRLNSIYQQDPTEFVGHQIRNENKLMRQSTDDAARRTRELLSARGLQNSSLGLGQEINQQKQLTDRMSLNNASGIARIRDMGIENGQGQMQAGQGLFNLKQAQGPIQMTPTTYRSGGYGQLIGAGIGAAGAYFGAGAK